MGRGEDSYIIIVKNRGLKSVLSFSHVVGRNKHWPSILHHPSPLSFSSLVRGSICDHFGTALDLLLISLNTKGKGSICDLICLSTWLNLSGYLFILFLYRLSQVLLTTPMWLRQRLTRLSGQLGTDNIHKLSKVVVFILVVLHTVFTQISTALK